MFRVDASETGKELFLLRVGYLVHCFLSSSLYIWVHLTPSIPISCRVSPAAAKAGTPENGPGLEPGCGLRKWDYDSLWNERSRNLQTKYLRGYQNLSKTVCLHLKSSRLLGWAGWCWVQVRVVWKCSSICHAAVWVQSRVGGSLWDQPAKPPASTVVVSVNLLLLLYLYLFVTCLSSLCFKDPQLKRLICCWGNFLCASPWNFHHFSFFFLSHLGLLLW